MEKFNNYDALAVGSGLSGATCARLLAEGGYKVLIIEQNKHIGGQVYDFKNEHGITIHKYGPHIFHTNSQLVWDFVNRFSDFSNYQHRVLSFVDGNFTNFPINRDTLNQVFGLNLSNEDIPAFYKNEIEHSVFNNPSQSFRDAIVSQVGERLYKLFFEKYTEKLWQCNPNDLLPELAGRIPIRSNNECRYFDDKYQGIPILGYTAMIHKMIDHENINLLLDCDYHSIKESLSPKLTIYTGELDKFFDYKYGKLIYRSIRLDFKTLEKDNFQPASVVNYPNDYDFTRITEFKRISGEIASKTTICYEYPSTDGAPFYTVPDQKNMELRKKYMQEVEKLALTKSYLFIGRLAEYKYYNMDEVIESAISTIEQWKK